LYLRFELSLLARGSALGSTRTTLPERAVARSAQPALPDSSTHAKVEGRAERSI